MSLKRRDMPLTTFDPRYKELILRGCRERVEIKQQFRKDAARLRNLLTTFRARMRAEWKGKDDGQWEPLYGAIIGLSDDGYSTVIRPRAQEAEHLLSNITFSEVSEPLSSAPQSALESDPLAEFDPPDGENK